jgi:hypothetical protein
MYRLIIFYVNFPINRDTKINGNDQFFTYSLVSTLYFTTRYQQLFYWAREGSTNDPSSKMTYLRLPLNAGSSLPKNLCARVLRRLLHQQVNVLLWAPSCHPRRGRGCAGYARRGSRRNDGAAAPIAASNDSSTLAARSHLQWCRTIVQHQIVFWWSRRTITTPMGWRRDCNWLLACSGTTSSSRLITASPRRATSPVASPEYTPASPEHTPTPSDRQDPSSEGLWLRAVELFPTTIVQGEAPAAQLWCAAGLHRPRSCISTSTSASGSLGTRSLDRCSCGKSSSWAAPAPQLDLDRAHPGLERRRRQWPPSLTLRWGGGLSATQKWGPEVWGGGSRHAWWWPAAEGSGSTTATTRAAVAHARSREAR